MLPGGKQNIKHQWSNQTENPWLSRKLLCNCHKGPRQMSELECKNRHDIKLFKNNTNFCSGNICPSYKILWIKYYGLSEGFWKVAHLSFYLLPLTEELAQYGTSYMWMDQTHDQYTKEAQARAPTTSHIPVVEDQTILVTSALKNT